MTEMSTIDLTAEAGESTSSVGQRVAVSTVYYVPIVERYCALMKLKAKSKKKTKTECERLLEKLQKKCEFESMHAQQATQSVLEAEKKALRYTAAYTGFTEDVITLMKSADIPIECESIEQTIYYQCLIRSSLNKIYFTDALPTLHVLFCDLRPNVPIYWTPDTVKKHLKQIGYMFKRVHGTKWRIIVERPELVFERFRYLKKINMFRKEGRIIFFIEENLFDSDRNYIKLMDLQEYANVYRAKGTSPAKWTVTYVVSENGVLTSKIHTETLDFSTFVLEDVLPLLPESSVIVYTYGNRRPKGKPKVTSQSTKAEIMAFLDEHSVPYSEDMRKVELSELMGTVRDTRSTYSLEDLIRSKGIEVLRLPPSLRWLSPGSPLYVDIKSKLAKISCDDPCLAIRLALKQSFEAFDFGGFAIKDDEKKQLKAEIIMDRTIENLERNIDVRRFTVGLDSDVSDFESD